MYGSYLTEVTEVRNGAFDLEMEYPASGPLLLHIKNGAIIAALPNDTDAEHNFIITDVKKITEEGRVYITASSVVNVVLADNLVKEYKATNVTPSQALNGMKLNTVDPIPFVFESNITTLNNIEWIRRNPMTCLVGQEGSLSDIWSGEIKKTNTLVSYFTKRGKDRVARIEAGKNLRGFTMNASTKGIITRILPYATITDGEGNETVLVGTVVTSAEAGKYSRKPVIAVDLTDSENVRSLAELNIEASKYFTSLNPGCDKPKISMVVNLLSLQDSPVYSKFKKLETINLCDTVVVYVPKYEVDVEIKVVELTYDALRGINKKITIGDQPLSTTGALRYEFNNQLQHTTNTLLTTILMSADGANANYYGSTAPVAPKEGDTWYKDIGSNQWEMSIYEGGTWIEVMGAATLQEVAAIGEAAQETADKAAKDAEDGLIVAEQARTEAATARSEAGFAKDQADNAITIANGVSSQLPAIRNTAQEALDAYTNMELGSQNYLRNSDYTVEKTNLVDNYTYVLSDEGLVKSLNEIYNSKYVVSVYVEARNMSKTPAGLSRAGYQAGVIYEDDSQGFITCLIDSPPSGNIEGKRYYVKYPPMGKKVKSIRYSALFSQTVADYVKISRPQIERGNKDSDWHISDEDVQVQITNINGELASKVTQTQFDTLNGIVTNQGTLIQQNKTEIALKANQSTVDTLTGRVSASEAAITLQKGRIDLLVTKTDGNTADISQLKVSTEGIQAIVSNVDYLGNQGDNLLMNGGFEADFIGWIKQAPHSITASAANVFTGRNSLEIKAQSSISAVKVANYISVIPGKTYEFGGVFKTSADANGTANNQKIRLGLPDGSYLAGVDFTGPSTAWRRLSKTIVIPANVNTVVLSIIANHTIGTVWWDDVIFRDYEAEVQYASLEIKVNGIQATVATKANQSDVMQLSDQIVSTVKKMNLDAELSKLSDSLILNKDVYFDKSANGVVLYNNSGGTAVSLIRENVPAGSQPSGKPYRLRVTTTGSPSSPGWGGVYQNTLSRLNAVFIHKFTALIPVGRELMRAGNSIGTGGTTEWLTPRLGTGKWETYAYVTRCGSSGTFAGFGHIYLQGGTTPTAAVPLVWYIDGMTMYDVTQSNQSQITQLSDQIDLRVTTAAHQSSITVLQSQINLKVTSTDYSNDQKKIVSTINLSPESIRIQSKFIHLSGTSLIDAAIIKDANIATLSATKLTAGTINGNVINVININANNIVSGKISAIDIVGGTITASILTGKNMTLNLTNGTFQTSTYANGGTSTLEYSTAALTWTDSRHATNYSRISGQAILSNGVAYPMLNLSSQHSLRMYLNGQDGSMPIISLTAPTTFHESIATMSAGTIRIASFKKEISLSGNVEVLDNLTVNWALRVLGSKNAIHITRDGVRATPAYETAESYLGDIGRALTQGDCQVWVPIEKLFGDIVNTDIPYEVFLQVYDDARVWVKELKSKAFLIGSDKPFVRFSWELKAKRRGYEHDRMVLQDDFKNEKIEQMFKEEQHDFIND